MKVRSEVAAQKQYLVDCRRQLHRIPEEAFQEYETSRFLKKQLEALKPDDLRSFAGTGLRAVFKGSRGQPPVAIRADMDALPVREPASCPFGSTNVGIMHACGHDAHMAIALGAARIVSEARPHLHRTYSFIFQPAEETTGGAEPMIREGVLLDPDVQSIYGLHLWPYLPQGRIGLKPGPLMAAMSDVNISVEGTSCHGAKPQDGSDAVVAAAQLITACQSIVSRSVNPFEAAVVTFGVLRAGDARNILAGRAELEGTVRSFTPAVHDAIRRRLRSILNGLEQMFAVRCEMAETMAYPPVVNSDMLYEKAKACFAKSEVSEPEPVMISEDFSFYQQQIPGLFMLLGTNRGADAPLHSAQFSFDENVLLLGTEYFLRVTGMPHSSAEGGDPGGPVLEPDL